MTDEATKNAKGRMFVRGMLAVTGIFTVCKLLGFFPVSWWLVLSPALFIIFCGWLAAFFDAAFAKAFEKVREQIREDIRVEVSAAVSNVSAETIEMLDEAIESRDKDRDE